MWVYSPIFDKEQAVVLTWNKRGYPVKKGINEIPEPVAHAYFVFGLPKELEENEEQFKLLTRQALLRWGVVLKSKPPEAEFLAKFVLSETREGLEDELKELNLIDGPVDMREEFVEKHTPVDMSASAIHAKLVKEAERKSGAAAK
jgi:hypothetical protein